MDIGSKLIPSCLEKSLMDRLILENLALSHLRVFRAKRKRYSHQVSSIVLESLMCFDISRDFVLESLITGEECTGMVFQIELNNFLSR